MRHYLGIDPGKQGAFCIMDDQAEITQLIGMPLIGKEYDKKEIREILNSYSFSRVGLENPDIIFGVGKSAVASLSNSVGLLEGLLIGCEIPYILIKPKEWQKECWKHIKVQKKADGKGNDTKATSALAAQNLFPATDFKRTNNGNPSKNYNDGFTDAALIAEYVRRTFGTPSADPKNATWAMITQNGKYSLD